MAKEKNKKLVSAKKLPKLFKKEYTDEQFEKKILNKIYIEDDKKLVQKLFESQKNEKDVAVLKVNLDKELDAAQVARCNQISKQIAAQKCGIKFVPLLAVVIAVVAVGVTVTLFKNVIVSNVIKGSMQGIFGAKTDIQKVNVEIFKANLDITGLAQANKDSPMKNLFEVEKIKLDFNLTELLRGKFHAENLEISGVALDTDRTKSGELPVKQKKTKQEKKINQEQNKLAEAAKEQLAAMFENYNPEKLLENLHDELKSPELAKTISEEVSKKVTKYQALPQELSKSVNDFSKSVDSILKTDWSKVNDIAKLKTALENINKAITEGNTLKTKLESSTNGIKTDSELVKKYSAELTSAIKADKSLVDSKVNEMKQLFSVDGLKSVMNNALQSMMYSVCGKYYPYLEKGMDFALNVKSSGDNKTPEQKQAEAEKKAQKKQKEAEKKAKQAQKAKSRERLKGRMVYYKKDRVPKFLIEKAVASGYEYGTDNLLFYATGSEISSDQNVRGEASKIDAMFKILGKQNNADITIDARKDSSEPLILANYKGVGFPIEADAQVFNLKSTSGITAKMTVTDNGGFTVGGTMDMALTEMNGMSFEPERVSVLYNKALSEIKNLTVGFTIGLDDNQNIVVSLDNLDKLTSQIVAPVTKVLTGEINNIATEARQNVTKVLDEKTGGATSSISSFLGIESDVNKEFAKVNDLQKQLEAKKKELSKQIANGAANAAKTSVTNAAGDLLKGLKK
ncbi:MAG: TIGR03545 family protein [Treponema sp.]|nr:TIGR03545 family protein [Treponema sp.]